MVLVQETHIVPTRVCFQTGKKTCVWVNSSRLKKKNCRHLCLQTQHSYYCWEQKFWNAINFNKASLMFPRWALKEELKIACWTCWTQRVTGEAIVSQASFPTRGRWGRQLCLISSCCKQTSFQSTSFQTVQENEETFKSLSSHSPELCVLSLWTIAPFPLILFALGPSMLSRISPKPAQISWFQPLGRCGLQWRWGMGNRQHGPCGIWHVLLRAAASTL